ncbi:protein-glutamate O-methyltransferase CheR [Lentimicrobium sp. S6]|uniref:CheR family methyltransferase n=1 Tax=Lentimicrobium sp. S6 TaxID=2735872 RepID=UPI001554CAE6|nr:CheR family methyltransferase [Lentimicrobium sp. S6]NPD46465.1 protein-glutamate O-methyltransferase CheR [Lentimicrobium sp. S6]
MSNHILEISDEVLESFLEKIFKTYGIDFRRYGKAHLKRRFRHRLTFAKYSSFTEMKEDVIKNKAAFDALFEDLSINVTELFRDPLFYESLHQFLVQVPEQKPLNIWISACASGEEAYSILMMMEHFKIPYERIVATDFNMQIVEKASKGVLDTTYIKEYLKNLGATNFNIDFYKFFDFKDDKYHLKEQFLKKITFATQNLMDEHHFGSFDLILCRNVLIYFEKELQNQVIDILTNSLDSEGLLCLGAKESLRFMDSYPQFRTIHQNHKIYQKK